MVFIKHNSLKSDIFFNVVIIPCFSGFMLFRVQSFLGSRLFRVFLGPGFSVSRFFRVQVFEDPGPGFSGSGSRVRV